MGCERHGGACAYDGTEPGRCPACHSTWEAIGAPHSARFPDQGGGSPSHHQEWHRVRDARSERDRVRRAASARAA
jgi:hypothetical protein